MTTAKFAFHTATNSAYVTRTFLQASKAPFMQLDTGVRVRIAERADLAEALNHLAGENLLSDGLTSCTRIEEVFFADFQDFAGRLANGDVLVESFPGEVQGTREGAFQPSISLVFEATGAVTTSAETFRVRGHLDANGWENRACPAFELVLPKALAREVARLTCDLSMLGEARIEWFSTGQRIYVCSVNLESHRLPPQNPVAVLSPGSSRGRAIQLRNLRSYSSPVRFEPSSDLSMAAPDRRLWPVPTTEDEEPWGRPIFVAAYPAQELIDLIPFAAGFVFERAALMCPTVIALRDSNCPAMVLSEATTRIEHGADLSLITHPS